MNVENGSNSLEELLRDIALYLNPEFYKLGNKDILNTKIIDKKKLNNYYLLLSNVNNALKKVSKYELYFAEFYPTTEKIKDHEALEHHVHAYLEDVDILRNKIKNFLDKLNKDLKKIAINKKEVEKEIKLVIKKNYDVFEGVSDHRVPHHHNGFKFLDSNLVDSEGYSKMAQDDFFFKNKLNPEVSEEFKKRAEETFEKSKADWIAVAKNNYIQINGFINAIFSRSCGYVHIVLNIKPYREFFNVK